MAVGELQTTHCSPVTRPPSSIALPSFGHSWTLVVASAELFSALGSAVDDEIEAELFSVPGACGSTTIVIVTNAPLSSEPRLHVTVPELWPQLPWSVVADWNVTPDGSRSVTTTPPALSGPKFSTFSVYVSGLPTTTGSGASSLVIERSADAAAATSSFVSVQVLASPACRVT